MNQWILLIVAVLVPFVTLAGIQVLRGLAGVWHSGGTDIIGLFIVFDATIAFDPTPFRVIVRSELLKDFVGQAALTSLIIGALLTLPIAVLYGEKKLIQAELLRAAGRTNKLPKLPLIIVWAVTIFYVAVHSGFAFGDWS